MRSSARSTGRTGRGPRWRRCLCSSTTSLCWRESGLSMRWRPAPGRSNAARTISLLRSTIVERFWPTPREERPRPLILAGLGVMAVDAAVAAIVIGVREAYGFWIVALVLLGLSLGVAVRVLRLPGTEQNGPLVAEILEARRANDDDTIEEQLLDDLAHETFANENALARKDPLVASAVTCLILGIVVEFAAQVLQ